MKSQYTKEEIESVSKAQIISYLNKRYYNSTKESVTKLYDDISFGSAGRYLAAVEILNKQNRIVKFEILPREQRYLNAAIERLQETENFEDSSIKRYLQSKCQDKINHHQMRIDACKRKLNLK